MSAFTTDNRWSPEASGAAVPAGAPAAYAARWIDKGSSADILPDRQGFAYSDTADRDCLRERLIEARVHTNLVGIEYDVTTPVVDLDGWKMTVRRAGGYVYVDAWLDAPEPDPAQVRAMFAGYGWGVTEA